MPRIPVVTSRAATAEPCDDLVVADTLLAVTRAEIEGRPEPFPTAASPDVSPHAFLADLVELERECPGVSVDHVDCDEYPCLAWVSATPCASKEDFLSHEVRDGLGLPNGDLAMWDMLYRMQPNERLHAMRVFDINRFDRTETRRRAALAALELKTGGTPLTELERASEDAAIARAELDVLEPDDPSHEVVQRRVDQADRRVASARHARGGVPPVPRVVVARPSTCEEAVAQRLAEIEDLRSAAYGDPAPFPPDLEPHLQPEAVEARARRVMTECPELGWTLHEVDCSEYPCITLWDGPDSDAWLDLYDCPAWSEVRARTTVRSSHFGRPDGTEVQIFAIAQFDPRPDDTWSTVPTGGRASRFEVRTVPALEEIQRQLTER